TVSPPLNCTQSVAGYKVGNEELTDKRQLPQVIQKRWSMTNCQSWYLAASRYILLSVGLASCPDSLHSS
ncbi:MAG: hypothetical protein ACYTXY_29175, partial [Nostoc sp.]